MVDAVRILWKEGFKISFSIAGNSAILSANKEGLLSLAAHLVALAEDRPGNHIHYGDNNSLEDNSAELVIERII